MPEAPFSEQAAGTTAAPFLKLAVGAREEAMGGAFAASASGPEALFLNPAGLAWGEASAEVGLGYQRLLETSYAGSAAFRAPAAGVGAVAAGLLYFSQSSLQAFDPRGDPAGRFTPYDLAASLAFAGRAYGEVSAGGAVKIVRSEIADASGTTAAFDLGVQARAVTQAGEGPVDLGAALRNLGPPLAVGSEASPLPLEFSGGMLWRATPGLSAAADLRLPVDDEPYLCVGFEAYAGPPGSRGFLRAGFNQARTRDREAAAGLSAGAGVDLSGLRLDYAWVPFGDLGSTHRISIGARF